jgi:hypothetical protein
MAIGGVLQADAVDAQSQDRLPALPALRREVVGVRDENLLGQRERPAEGAASTGKTVRHGGVQRPDLRRHRGLPMVRRRLQNDE